MGANHPLRNVNTLLLVHLAELLRSETIGIRTLRPEKSSVCQFCLSVCIKREQQIIIGLGKLSLRFACGRIFYFPRGFHNHCEAFSKVFLEHPVPVILPLWRADIEDRVKEVSALNELLSDYGASLGCAVIPRVGFGDHVIIAAFVVVPGCLRFLDTQSLYRSLFRISRAGWSRKTSAGPSAAFGQDMIGKQDLKLRQSQIAGCILGS